MCATGACDASHAAGLSPPYGATAHSEGRRFERRAESFAPLGIFGGAQCVIGMPSSNTKQKSINVEKSKRIGYCSQIIISEIVFIQIDHEIGKHRL